MNNTKEDTMKLYWEKPYDTRFTARVTGVQHRDAHSYVRLDSTLFHPEGGGQPCDKGVIAPAPLDDLVIRQVFQVEEVLEDDKGGITHVLPPISVPLQDFFKKGLLIQGEINWERRFDFMQQHTGQHILSAAFEKICGSKTLGFHLSDDYVSIDLDAESIQESRIRAVEDLANEIIFKNLPVTAHLYEQDEVPSTIRRRIPRETDRTRIIFVGDFDACACGGTHVVNAGELGIIKINQLDRSHGKVRVIFRCGKRALLDLREKESELYGAAHLLSVNYKDVGGAVSRLMERSASSDKEIGRLKTEITEHEIRDLAEKMGRQDVDMTYPEQGFEKGPWIVRGQGFVVIKYDGKQPSELRFMARKLGEMTGELITMLSQSPGFSFVAVSFAPDSDASHLNASLLVSKLAGLWGLKGGGTPHIAQTGSKEPLDKHDREVFVDISRIIHELNESWPT